MCSFFGQKEEGINGSPKTESGKILPFSQNSYLIFKCDEFQDLCNSLAAYVHVFLDVLISYRHMQLNKEIQIKALNEHYRKMPAEWQTLKVKH